MQQLIVSTTTQYILGAFDPGEGSLITLKVVGASGTCSFIPKIRRPGDGTTNLVSVPYFNVGTNASVAADVAITANGLYQIVATGPEVLLDATVSSGSATVSWWTVLGGVSGGGSGGGGGGGATTIADGADVALGTTTDAVVTAPSGASATAISLLKGIDQGVNSTPANPPAFQLALNDGTPVGDTAAHGMFVKTGGNIADGSAATGSLANLVGGVDNAGTPVVRTMQVIPMNASPNQASTFGLLTYSVMATLSSGFENPVKSIGSIGSGTTGLFAGSTGLIGYNGTTYDVIKSINQALQVAGTSASIQSTLTVSTSPAYTAGDNVGGLVTLTNAMRYSGGTGVLQNILVTDHSNQKPNLDIIIFKNTPAATFTDNAAFPTLSQADDALVLCRISVGASDWVTVGGSAFTALTFQPKVVAAVGSANLLMALNTSSTPTFVATTDIMVTTGFLQD